MLQNEILSQCVIIISILEMNELKTKEIKQLGS